MNCEKRGPLLIELITFLRFPFNWRTPFGYAIAWLGTYATMFASLFSCSPIMCLLISSCWLIKTFTTDVKADLSRLTHKINDQKLKKRLSSIVQQFCTIEQLSDKWILWATNLRIFFISLRLPCRFIIHFNNIYEFIIFGYFAWSLTSMGAALFLLVTILVE